MAKLFDERFCEEVPVNLEPVGKNYIRVLQIYKPLITTGNDSLITSFSQQKRATLEGGSLR
ncbi:MAG: hypothetical protein V2I46_08785 [Bacteroides sp.]|jgi:hypothetical protein|nr:hypothetical protein [Bacteroides sp.]